MNKPFFIDKDNPLYCFGYLNDDTLPRPLVLMAMGDFQYRPATMEEFLEHHEDMAKNVLLDRVWNYSKAELLKLIDGTQWTPA